MQGKTNEYKEHMEIFKILYSNVNSFQKYGVDKYMSCNCLSVASAYQGLNIGQRLLEAMYGSASNQIF